MVFRPKSAPGESQGRKRCVLPNHGVPLRTLGGRRSVKDRSNLKQTEVLNHPICSIMGQLVTVAYVYNIMIPLTAGL